MLKYVTKKTKTRDNEPVDDDTVSPLERKDVFLCVKLLMSLFPVRSSCSQIEKEVAEIEEQDRSMAVLTQDIDEDGKVRSMWTNHSLYVLHFTSLVSLGRV